MLFVHFDTYGLRPLSTTHTVIRGRVCAHRSRGYYGSCEGASATDLMQDEFAQE